MPFTQQDAEGIGRNISQALFPSYHERRADRAASADLKRKQALEEMIATIAQKNAMEQLAARERGDMERTKLREDREDVRDIRRAGIMNDNARMAVEQRAAEAEAEKEWRSKIAADELKRRTADDAMSWWDRAAELQLDKRKYELNKQDSEAQRPLQRMRAQTDALNAAKLATEAGLDLEDEIMRNAGIKIGQPKSAQGKTTRQKFQSLTVKPAVTNVDYSVTKDATNVPMPPDENGNRKSSTAGSNAASAIPGGEDVRRFMQILTDKSLKPR